MLKKCPSWQDKPTLFVDGGARWRSQWPAAFRCPTLSVGDGDSLGSDKLDILLNTDKDCSDLAYALQLIDTLPLKKLTLLGFLGGRRDHEWINLGEIAALLGDKKQLRADFDTDISLFAPGRYTLQYQGLFSLVYFENATTTLQGNILYCLDNAPVKAHSSHGLSNEARGEFQLQSNRVSLLFFNQKQN